MLALPFAFPFRRHRNWQAVFVLFGLVRLENDQRHHVLIGRRVLRRYSTTRRQWVWTARTQGHADLSVSSTL